MGARAAEVKCSLLLLLGIEYFQGMTASLTSGSAVQQAKHRLRKQISNRLKQIPPDQLALQCNASTLLSKRCEIALTDTVFAARRVIDRLVSSASYRSAASISCYLSLPHSEIQTDSLIHDALAQGKHVYVPYCPVEDKTTMRMVRLRDTNHFDGLRPNRWGIREVDPKEVSPSLIFSEGTILHQLATHCPGRSNRSKTVSSVCPRRAAERAFSSN